MTDAYAVIGNPIAHSLSPHIHTQFAQQTGQDIHYTKHLSPLDQFQQTVKTFFALQAGKGLNVTVPFKQEAWQLCDEMSDYARLAGAVNTLVYRQDKTIWGTNTDGIGLVTDLEVNHQFKLAGKKILILGAGGAVRGVLQPILEKQPQQLFIANRTVSKAHQLAAIFEALDDMKILVTGGYDDIPQTGFDIIINATAASLQGDIPPIPEHSSAQTACCYDMMYSKEPTAFVQWAKQRNVPLALDGLGMLVEQAAESFNLWRGVKPDTPSVLQQLRNDG